MKARGVRIFPDKSTGSQLVAVPLGRNGTEEAVLDYADYSELMRMGVYPNWQMRGGGVASRCPAGPIRTRGSSKASSVPILISRILMDAKAGQKVSYMDNNPLNLRRKNLELREGWSSKSDRALLLEGIPDAASVIA